MKKKRLTVQHAAADPKAAKLRDAAMLEAARLAAAGCTTARLAAKMLMSARLVGRQLLAGGGCLAAAADIILTSGG